MVDVTILGGGVSARACGEILTKAGFRLRHTFEIEKGDRSPIILGEVQGAFQLAREAIEAGRHLMVASPLTLGPERLPLIMEGRKQSQAIFVWSERRYHPGYHFVAGLIEADADWRPRYLRQETLCAEPTNASLARWRVMEALSLVSNIAGDTPMQLAASSVDNAKRNAPDLISLELAFRDLQAYIHIGLGEPIDRRETLLASNDRKAFVDELNQTMPVRIVEDEPQSSSSASRWLSCPSPSAEELVRMQCLAFLDATLKGHLAQDEAQVWLRSMASMEAMEQSLRADGAPFKVITRDESTPRFRLIMNKQSNQPPPLSIA